MYRVLYLIILLILTDCLSERHIIKSVRKGITTKVTSKLYSVPTIEDGVLKERDLSSKDIKNIEVLLSEYIFYLRKGYEKKLPYVKVLVSNNEGLNAVVDCDNRTITLYSGVIRKALVNAIEYSFSYSEDNFFSNDRFLFDDSSGSSSSKIKNMNSFIYYLYNYKPKQMGVIKVITGNYSEDEELLSDTYIDLTTMTKSVDMELSKIIAFIVFHEYGHIISDCQQGKKSELNADLFGASAYIYYFQELDNLSYSMDDTSITGRDIESLIKDIYGNSIYTEEGAYHPSLDQRIHNIDSLIDLNRVNYWEYMLNELIKNL